MNELRHHGTLGMKWGVRRYQNLNGSLTEEGRRRYRKGTYTGLESVSDEELRKKVTRMTLESQYNKLKPPPAPSQLETAKKAVNEAEQSVNKLKEVRKQMQPPKKKIVDVDLRTMTDDELRNAINRGNLEKQYTDIFGHTEMKQGKITVDKILEMAGPALAVTSTALSIALAMKSLKGGGSSAVPK